MITELHIGWWNGWWYPVIFGLINRGLMAAYGPRIFGKRLIRLPPFASRMERILSMDSMLLFARGMMIHSVFVTLK